MDVSSLTYAISIDNERCTRCGACARACTLVRFGRLSGVEAVPREVCMQCGHCVAVCPQGAVLHPEFPAESLTPACPPSAKAIMGMLQYRRSIRHFADRPVEREQWEALLAAMSQAPSGMNARPVRAVVVTEREKLQAMTTGTSDLFGSLLKMLDSPFGRIALRMAIGKDGLAGLQQNAFKLATICRLVKEGGDPILYHAPGALILHAPKTAVCGRDDCLLAAMAGMLHAPALGLGSCMIGFLLPPFQRVPALRAMIDLPADHEVHAVLAVGYPSIEYHFAPPRPAILVNWK